MELICTDEDSTDEEEKTTFTDKLDDLEFKVETIYTDEGTIIDQEETTCKVKKEKSFLNSSMSRSEAKEKSPCPLCQKDMNKQSLKKHFQYFHKKEIPIDCRVCMEQLPNETAFVDHLVSRHADVTNLEDIASARDLKVGVTKSRNNKNKNIRISCPKCHKLFHRDSLSRHMNEVHNEIFELKCKLCPEVFGKFTHRVKHMQTVHGYAKRECDELFTCPICKKDYRGGKCRLNLHIRRVHLDTEKVFKCDQCDRKFKSTYLMRLHRRVHSNECPYLCKICQKKFRHSGSCRKHVQTVHKIELKYSLNNTQYKHLVPYVRLPTKRKPQPPSPDESPLHGGNPSDDEYEIVAETTDEEESYLWKTDEIENVQ